MKQATTAEKEARAKKTKKTRAINNGLAVGAAIIGHVGLNKANEWAAIEGGATEIAITAVETVGGGAAVFLGKQPWIKALGAVSAANGASSLTRALITDDTGAVKDNGVSKTLAKVVMPTTTSLNGYSGPSLGTLAIAENGVMVDVPETAYASPLAR